MNHGLGRISLVRTVCEVRRARKCVFACLCELLIPQHSVFKERLGILLQEKSRHERRLMSKRKYRRLGSRWKNYGEGSPGKSEWEKERSVTQVVRPSFFVLSSVQHKKHKACKRSKS